MSVRQQVSGGRKEEEARRHSENQCEVMRRQGKKNNNSATRYRCNRVRKKKCQGFLAGSIPARHQQNRV